MALKSYDPKLVTITFGPVLVTGFADGQFLSIEQNEDAFALKIGSDGEGARARSNNNSARITITLMQSSLANDFLAAQHELDKTLPFGAGTVPLLIKDLSGRALFFAQNAWIVKYPTSGFDREVMEREWVIETDNLVNFPGGN